MVLFGGVSFPQSGKKKGIGRVSLGHAAGQTGVYQSGFPDVYSRKSARKEHFCRDTGRVFQGHPAVQGFVQKLYVIVTSVLYLFPKVVTLSLAQETKETQGSGQVCLSNCPNSFDSMNFRERKNT